MKRLKTKWIAALLCLACLLLLFWRLGRAGDGAAHLELRRRREGAFLSAETALKLALWEEEEVPLAEIGKADEHRRQMLIKSTVLMKNTYIYF